MSPEELRLLADAAWDKRSTTEEGVAYMDLSRKARAEADRLEAELAHEEAESWEDEPRHQGLTPPWLWD